MSTIIIEHRPGRSVPYRVYIEGEPNDQRRTFTSPSRALAEVEALQGNGNKADPEALKALRAAAATHEAAKPDRKHAT